MANLDGVSLAELHLRATLLRSIIAEYEGDPRLPGVQRQLDAILREIQWRKNPMSKLDKMTPEELEAERAAIQEQIEGLRELFVEAGKILEQKREEAHVAAEIAKLEERKKELEAKVVKLKTLDLRSVFSKIFGGG